MDRFTSFSNLILRATLACSLVVIACLSGGYQSNAAQAQTFDVKSLMQAASPVGAGQALGAMTRGVVQGIAQQAGANLNLPLTSTGLYSLDVVSTGSVNINDCDLPFIRSNGGGGAFPSGSSGGAGGDGGSGPAPLPDLPPGWIGVQNSHNGGYMGAIPPGGNIVDFFRGAYGIAPGEEGEANYILNNQLYQLWSSGAYAGLWGQYEQSGPPH